MPLLISDTPELLRDDLRGFRDIVVLAPVEHERFAFGGSSRDGFHHADDGGRAAKPDDVFGNAEVRLAPHLDERIGILGALARLFLKVAKLEAVAGLRVAHAVPWVRDDDGGEGAGDFFDFVVHEALRRECVVRFVDFEARHVRHDGPAQLPRDLRPRLARLAV
ncbi:MAG TPA: hypothetical protein VI997_10060, partial [Candidatus Thermoplasmatota archaeon]|nr:hypothetical protein [Candidatus Thermoplasmatota archaeon]